MEQQESGRDVENSSEPDRTRFIQDKHDQADYNKWIKPDYVQVPSHLHMIGKKIEKDHQHCKYGKHRIDNYIEYPYDLQALSESCKDQYQYDSKGKDKRRRCKKIGIYFWRFKIKQDLRILEQGNHFIIPVDKRF